MALVVKGEQLFSGDEMRNDMDVSSAGHDCYSYCMCVASALLVFSRRLFAWTNGKKVNKFMLDKYCDSELALIVLQ